MRARRRNLERQKPSGGPVIHDAPVYGAIRTVSLAISCRDLQGPTEQIPIKLESSIVLETLSRAVV